MHDLESPAVQVGVTLVHAQQVAGEQRRLVAAGAGAHLDDGVAFVRLVARQQEHLDGALKLGQPGLRRGEFLIGQCPHLGVAVIGGDDPFEARDFIVQGGGIPSQSRPPA